MRQGPLGVTLERGGALFSVFSAHAAAIELCLFDASGRETRVATKRDADEWRVFVPNVGAGRRYGYRVHGAYAPATGDRFNPAKLLIDPYARAFDGKADYAGPLFGFDRTKDDAPDLRDDATFVPKSVVVADTFDWRGDAPLLTAWNETRIYELHVKGFSKANSAIEERLRGTYLGLAADPSIAYLKSIGVTAVELLPVHECMNERSVAARGADNYWGYSTLGYFAPDQRFATKGGDPVTEFKTMVQRLHAAGIEVILDVVYNHTCEGDELGPTVSFRGLDNRSYYSLKGTDPRKYVDYTGCGNTFDTSSPYGLRLVLDSLRYWCEVMHVDGFRFDLAPALARKNGAFDPNSPLFHAIFQDPILGRAKLIAEPWDCGPDAVKLGSFPPPWREWNADFRDGARRFWNGTAKGIGDIATRIAGSSDVYAASRGPTASLNFVTAHDGFTLRDWTSYAKKHNLANGENDRDGNDQNDSTNFGVEGETTDPSIVSRRERLARSMLATLLFSAGVPMITAGDEGWRTQGGNNNPYVLDSATSWLEWSDTPARAEMLSFFRAIMSLRGELEYVKSESFFLGDAVGKEKDVTWFRSDGVELDGDDWDASTSLGAWFSSAAEDVVLLLNASALTISYSLPKLLVSRVSALQVIVDTTTARVPAVEHPLATSRSLEVDAHAFVLLRAAR